MYTFYFLSCRICVRSDKQPFKCMCNSSSFQRRALSIDPSSFLSAGQIEPELPDLWAQPRLRRAKKEACIGPQHIRGPVVKVDWCAVWNGGPTAAWPSFTRVSFHVLIWQKNAWKSGKPAPTGLTYMTEAPWQKLIFREALWARDSLVAFGAL